MSASRGQGQSLGGHETQQGTGREPRRQLTATASQYSNPSTPASLGPVVRVPRESPFYVDQNTDPSETHEATLRRMAAEDDAAYRTSHHGYSREEWKQLPREIRVRASIKTLTGVTPYSLPTQPQSTGNPSRTRPQPASLGTSQPYPTDYTGQPGGPSGGAGFYVGSSQQYTGGYPGQGQASHGTGSHTGSSQSANMRYQSSGQYPRPGGRGYGEN